MLLAVYAATALALALATPPPQLTIQYTWSKSGFVVLRKELTISQNGDYETAYNGKQSCYEKGKVSPAANVALWQEAQALLSPPRQAKNTPAPHRTPRPRHTQPRRTAMDNGPPVETVSITNGVDSSIVLDPSLPTVRHFIDEVRQLLPPCAF